MRNVIETNDDNAHGDALSMIAVRSELPQSNGTAQKGVGFPEDRA